MVTVRVERSINASPEQVFAWLADPANLSAAPLVLRARWTEQAAEPGLGAVRGVISAGTWFREEITAYEPPRTYSYRIIRSFPTFDHDGGTLTLTPTDGGTHVTWVTTYTHPAHVGGKALEAITSRLLPWNFRVILAQCAVALER